MDNLNLGKHISHQFNAELEQLRLKILEMGGLVEQQIDNAIISLIDEESDAAVKVKSGEQQVNQMEVDIDTQCLNIMARRQPAASDLRLMIASSRIISDLERAGDEAEKLARLSKKLSGIMPAAIKEKLANEAKTQLKIGIRTALNSFARTDKDMALQAIFHDKKINALYRSALEDLVNFMKENPKNISKLIEINLILRSIERIGDHCRNIGEHIIYLISGADVRHMSLNDVRLVADEIDE